MNDLSGHLSWNSQSRNVDLDAAFDTPLARAVLRLGSKDGETGITLTDLPAIYAAHILDIEKDAPVTGIVSSGTLTINREFIRGRAVLNAGLAQPPGQPFLAVGTIDFQRDKKIKQTTFSGQRLLFNGGRLNIEGKIASQAKTTRIQVDAALENLENIATYSAFYLGIDLLPWKLSKGGGSFHLELDKRPGRKQIDSRFQMNNFLANQQAISSLQGTVRDTPLVGRGDFLILAPDLRSRVEMNIENHKTTIRFPDAAGEARKIMKIMDLDLDLQGRISGDFSYISGRAVKQAGAAWHPDGPAAGFHGPRTHPGQERPAHQPEKYRPERPAIRLQGRAGQGRGQHRLRAEKIRPAGPHRRHGRRPDFRRVQRPGRPGGRRPRRIPERPAGDFLPGGQAQSGRRCRVQLEGSGQAPDRFFRFPAWTRKGKR